MKNNIFSKLSLLLIFPLSFLLVNKIQANSLNNNVRVVALTSLTADIINTISKDALVGAVEGKLPLQMKDGKLLPIEMTVTVRFDPNTQKLEVVS